MANVVDALDRIATDLGAVGPHAGSVDTSTDALRALIDAVIERGNAIERVRRLCGDALEDSELAAFARDILAALNEDQP